MVFLELIKKARAKNRVLGRIFDARQDTLLKNEVYGLYRLAFVLKPAVAILLDPLLNIGDVRFLLLILIRELV